MNVLYKAKDSAQVSNYQSQYGRRDYVTSAIKRNFDNNLDQSTAGGYEDTRIGDVLNNL